MKIRGTPAHIAEKYIALSRDAQSNGDPVLSENYLQHAEHYNRIILAYRDAQAQQQASEQPAGPSNGHSQPRSNGQQDQPRQDEIDQPSIDHDASGELSDTSQPPRRQQSRGRQSESRSRSPRARRPRPQSDGDGQETRQDQRNDSGGVPEHEQPEFLRRSVRRPRREKPETDTTAASEEAQD